MPPEYTRVCSYCQEPREPLHQQHRPNRGKLICNRCARRSYGADRRVAARRYQRGKALLEELKSGPCVDCGKRYIPRAMHFDHRDPSTKRYNISRLVSANRIAAILAEVAKCDLVCVLCHAYRTERLWQSGFRGGRPRLG